MAKYACKQCGAELFFDPKIGKLHCEYCDSVFDPAEFDFKPEENQEKAASNDRTAEQNLSEEEIAAAKAKGMSDAQAKAAAEGSKSTDDSTGDLVAYCCPNCGAEIITAKETIMTTCVYCNKAITVEGNMAGEFKPDYVLPFKKTKEEVEEAYMKLCKASILTPPAFMRKDNIKKIKGMYIPFWLYSFHGDGRLRVRGENIRTWIAGDMEYTEIKRYAVEEEVEAGFEKIPVDALKKMDNDMMDSIETVLPELGIARSKIHTERFNTGSGKKATAEQIENRNEEKVNIVLDGRELIIEVSKEDDSILDAALRAGADLPYACKGGVCATCKCKVLEGQVDMAINYSLEPEEVEKGYVLSCQARPVTPNVRISFDD